MTKHNLTNTEELLLWQEVKTDLKQLQAEPPASIEDVDELLALLPKRQANESFRQWLERSHTQLWEFEPLTEIIRLAADTSNSEFPLPDPGRALESQDGQFRLYISAPKPGKIVLKIEALGFAADQFAQQSIGIAGEPRVEAVIARIDLNEEGDGFLEVEDQPEVRQALLRPIIGKLWKKTDA
jgi:hypothetical protein